MRIPAPIGKVFGRLTVIREVPSPDEYRRIECLCSCGREKLVRLHDVKSGRTKSCGCKTASCGGLSKVYPSEYNSWSSMRNRCYNPNDKNYPHYGGRGISVCKEWGDFSAFIRDMGPRPEPGYSLDRINNDGNYCPDNCRWTTQKEQVRNTRRAVTFSLGGEELRAWEVAEIIGISPKSVHSRSRQGTPIDRPRKGHIVAFGRSQSYADWSAETGIRELTLRNRIKDGWDPERAVTQKPRKGSWRRKG